MIAVRRSPALQSDAVARAQGNSPGFRPRLPRQTLVQAHRHQGEVGVGARPADPQPPPSATRELQPRFHPPRVAKPRHDDFGEYPCPPQPPKHGGFARPWDGVDLAAGLISVECSWDQKQGPVEPKSAAGFRRTPIAAVLRDYLVQHRVTQDKDKRALVFGLTDGAPFSPSTVAQRAERAWRAGGLEPVTLHECRHTFATLMIAAGVNAKAAPDVHGPLVDHGHARPLRTPVPRLRRASCAPARRLPQGCPRACTQG
jgi:Phage integrase family